MSDDTSKLPVLQKEHPNSRKAKRKAKEEQRDTKLKMERKLHRVLKQAPLVDMVKWFRDSIIALGINETNIRIVTQEELFVLSVNYCCRKDVECDDIDDKIKKMLHTTSSIQNKRDRILEEISNMRKALIGGVDIPDLLDLDNIKFILTVRDIYVTIKQSLKLRTVKYAMKDTLPLTTGVELAIKKFERKFD
ncbi:hypothetical protein ENU1_043000 [Entamoeba nuttalli P19]|uniref:Uncharacterized protein n=2 Tax=Entamoeba nuttalli TaxID=412467 RepID=K2HG48_ENTNP|nr:hypothetical protein ENU1_043000 [Entamoeba nuttalli P19]EKE41844.1 hypothetical protein ENU1_043000 [Entamoeba nuttalli P19]|eukprot:XP_008855825.1 hypothetical protein ENU1_043000 [Entamoeba nuttalli P19]